MKEKEKEFSEKIDDENDIEMDLRASNK